jgi:hypothetical protein
MEDMHRIAKRLPPPSLPVALAITLAVAVALPSLLRAQDKDEEELTWYAVEIIVFERTSEIGRNAEAWPAEPGLPKLADALELSVEGMAPEELEAGPREGNDDEGQPRAQDETRDSAATETIPETEDATASPRLLPRAFQLIAPGELRLTDAWKSLEKSGAYRPLLHIGWVQPGFPAEEARLIHVRNDNAALGAITISADAATDAAGEDAVEETVPTFDGGAGDAPSLSSRIDFARDPSQVALDGTLRVHRARYLHVQADLLYYRPVAGDGGASPATQDDPATIPAPDSSDTAYIEQLLAEEDVTPRLFRLTESRRMRSRELHYLDHPLFGVLVEAWPVELPELPAEAPLPTEADAATDEGGAAQPVPLLPAPTDSGSGG